MEDKKIDNSYTNYKKELSIIDNKISQNKSEIQKLDSIQADYMDVSVGINKCFDMLKKSIQAEFYWRQLDGLISENTKQTKNVINFLDDAKDSIYKKINELNAERENIQDKRIKEQKENDI